MAAEAFADVTTLTELRVLNLNGADIGDRGAHALATNPALKNLLALDLRYNAITKVGGKALLESSHLSNLIYLNVDNNNIADSVRTALRKRFGPSVAKYKPSFFKKKR